MLHDEFVGTGWSFPIDFTANGTIATADGARKLEQAMALVLATYPGERPFRPAFGSRLRDFAFEGSSVDVYASVEREVRTALDLWEPRVGVRDVAVRADPDQPSLLLIDITYRIHGENDERNLVYPFYTIPDEGDY